MPPASSGPVRPTGNEGRVPCPRLCVGMPCCPRYGCIFLKETRFWRTNVRGVAYTGQRDHEALAEVEIPVSPPCRSGRRFVHKGVKKRSAPGGSTEGARTENNDGKAAPARGGAAGGPRHALRRRNSVGQ